MNGLLTITISVLINFEIILQSKFYLTIQFFVLVSPRFR